MTFWWPLLNAVTPAVESKEVTSLSLSTRMFAQYSTQYTQSYYSIAIFFFIAFALCGVLAGLSYLLSLSTAQSTEKRSEYECGFAPFDSATRLPFDVHFYLVGILFLIFDVEVALLFPWVLTLRTIGWFGFYLMLGFLFVLSIGFLFEWKRGALLWPSRRNPVKPTTRSYTDLYGFDDDDGLPFTDASIALEDFLFTETYSGADAPEPEEPFTHVEMGQTTLLNPFGDVNLLSYPLLVEGLLFLLICYVITLLSFSLGRGTCTGALSYFSWQTFRIAFFLLMGLSAYQLYLNDMDILVYGGYFETGMVTGILKLVTLFSVTFVLDFSSIYLREHSRYLLEYATIIGFTALFMLLLISAAHVMSLFLSLVGFSLGLYVLILYDVRYHVSREAGLKYYFLSALSSGLVLYGLLLLYIAGSTGTFAELHFLFGANLPTASSLLLGTATVIALTGFFFKLSSAPGHLWAADVYEGSPAPVTAFFMLPVKVTVLAAFINLFPKTLVALSAFWLPILSLAALISILWGAFAAVQEKKVRRFFAYASINQMGFLLLGFTADSDGGFVAAMLYIIVYAIMTAALLLVYLTARLTDGRQLTYLSDFRSLSHTNWHFAWVLAIILFSMAGIPPLAGFFAKYFVLLEVFQSGLYLLVIAALATSLISAFYYIRLIKTAMFESIVGAGGITLKLNKDHVFLLTFFDALLLFAIGYTPALLDLLTTAVFPKFLSISFSTNSPFLSFLAGLLGKVLNFIGNQLPTLTAIASEVPSVLCKQTTGEDVYHLLTSGSRFSLADLLRGHERTVMYFDLSDKVDFLIDLLEESEYISEEETMRGKALLEALREKYLSWESLPKDTFRRVSAFKAVPAPYASPFNAAGMQAFREQLPNIFPQQIPSEPVPAAAANAGPIIRIQPPAQFNADDLGPNPNDAYGPS